MARLYTLATPYATADLPLLKYVQSADTMTLTHPSYAPRNLTRTGPCLVDADGHHLCADAAAADGAGLRCAGLAASTMS